MTRCLFTLGSTVVALTLLLTSNGSILGTSKTTTRSKEQPFIHWLTKKNHWCFYILKWPHWTSARYFKTHETHSSFLKHQNYVTLINNDTLEVRDKTNYIFDQDAEEKIIKMITIQEESLKVKMLQNETHLLILTPFSWILYLT